MKQQMDAVMMTMYPCVPTAATAQPCLAARQQQVPGLTRRSDPCPLLPSPPSPPTQALSLAPPCSKKPTEAAGKQPKEAGSKQRKEAVGRRSEEVGPQASGARRPLLLDSTEEKLRQCQEQLGGCWWPGWRCMHRAMGAARPHRAPCSHAARLDQAQATWSGQRRHALLPLLPAYRRCKPIRALRLGDGCQAAADAAAGWRAGPAAPRRTAGEAGGGGGGRGCPGARGGGRLSAAAGSRRSCALAGAGCRQVGWQQAFLRRLCVCARACWGGPA
jgi:hypothetical protein